MSQKEIITMTKQELERLTIVNNLIKGIINGTEASKQLRLSVRQVKRIKARVIKLGSKGVIHKSRGRQGNRKFSQDFKDKVGRLLKTKYYYFTPLMATEHLLVEYNVKLSKETIRKWMTEQGLWKVKQRKQREVYRSQRKRKDHYGEMQQFDGSYHKWIHGLDEEQCLLASIDDATGKITHAHFEKNEGVIAVFKFWKKYIEINAVSYTHLPGRFDRKVIIDLPDIKEREDILKIHSKGKPLGADIDLREVAERTPGFSGADLENVINEAAILTAKNEEKVVSQKNVLESIEKVLLGPEKRSKIIGKEEKEIAAYHEAGHAIVASFVPKGEPVRKISIISRGIAAGYTLSLIHI